jgi:transposase-like protein
MLPDKQGKRVSGPRMLEMLNVVCQPNTIVATDDFKAYNILDKKNQNNFVRVTVNHSLGQYSTGNGIHTNGIENFWSVFKPGTAGTYRHMSVKYMQQYVNEFCFRQNTRLHPNAFNVLLSRCVLPKAA